MIQTATPFSNRPRCNQILLILALINAMCPISIHAQTPKTLVNRSSSEVRRLQERIEKVESDQELVIRQLRDSRSDLNLKIQAANAKIDDLTIKLDTSEKNVKSLNEQLGDQISTAETKADERFRGLDGLLSRTSQFVLIAGLGLAMLSGSIYWLLRRKLRSEKTDIIDNIRQTREALEEEGLKLDNKLIEVLDAQLRIGQGSSTVVQAAPDAPDHTLALKVADEVIRIEKNLSAMEPETKGLRQLSGAVRRIKDNFAANGYELVEMLNKPYKDGMQLVANFRPYDTLEPDQQIITRIIKPQVNFQGKMIQAAQIEVSQG